MTYIGRVYQYILTAYSCTYTMLQRLTEAASRHVCMSNDIDEQSLTLIRLGLGACPIHMLPPVLEDFG